MGFIITDEYDEEREREVLTNLDNYVRARLPKVSKHYENHYLTNGSCQS